MTQALTLIAVPVAAVLFLWAQGLWTRWRVPQLPEAEGPRMGVVGAGEPILKLMVIGESPAAGVGVDHQQEALAGRIAESLHGDHDLPCHWCVVARSGLQSEQLLPLLADGPRGFDVVVLVLGINDTKDLRSVSHWQSQLGHIAEHLHAAHPEAMMVWCGVPDLARFPALPWPLRAVMGWRARQFDRILEAFCQSRPGCHYLAVPIGGPEGFASDGFHPGPAGHQAWGQQVAALIAATVGVED